MPCVKSDLDKAFISTIGPPNLCGDLTDLDPESSTVKGSTFYFYQVIDDS